MALTVAQLSAALRIGDGTAEPEEPTLSILTRLKGVGEAIVEVESPGAPDAIKDEAVIRVAGYLYDQPEAPSMAGHATAWMNSGASSLVSRWVKRRAHRVGGNDG